jgi:hypothetical protein
MLRADLEAWSQRDRPRALVISPYRPQSELLQAMLHDLGLDGEARAGTIHSFQGSEASIVLLDLTVDEPHYRPGLFAAAHRREHQRMLNVAVTRARRRLAIVADAAFIREKADTRSAVRELMWRVRVPVPQLSAVQDVMPLERDDEPLVAALRAARRSIIWYERDPRRRGRILAEVVAAAERSVPTVVVTDVNIADERRVFDTPGMTLARAGAALFAKDPVRESVLMVDDRFIALSSTMTGGYSVWTEPRVAAILAEVLHSRGLLDLAARGKDRCPRCNGVVVLLEGNHEQPGTYAKCYGCEAPVAITRNRPTPAPARRQA